MSALLALAFLRSIVSVEPVDASTIGCRMAGLGYAEEVARICRTESRCSRIGLHVGHAPRVRGEVFEARARRAGWIGNDCPGHVEGGARWGVRGPHGNVAAYSVRHLQRCAVPEVVDVPLLSAIVACRRLEELRARYGKRSAAARALAWRHGAGCRCERCKKSTAEP